MGFRGLASRWGYPICLMRADFKPYEPCPYSGGCHEDVCPLKDHSPSSVPLWHLLSHGGAENLGLSYNTFHDQTKTYPEAITTGLCYSQQAVRQDSAYKVGVKICLKTEFRQHL